MKKKADILNFVFNTKEMHAKSQQRKEWNEVTFPKSLLKDGKVEVETVQKGPNIKEKANTAMSAASMLKGFKPPKATKKRGLARGDFLSKTTPEGKYEWDAIKNTVIGNRATTKMPVSKWIDVPEGMEVTEGGKLKKAEGFDLEGIRQRKVTTMEETGIPRWTDAYTGETITNRDDIHIDHTVSIDRARRSGKFKKLGDAQLFGTYIKNLVITKAKTNELKGAKDLGQFEPTHEPGKYAQRYGSMLSEFGLIAKYQEAQAFNRMTGQDYESTQFEHSQPGETNPVQHILDMQRGEPIAESQTRHDMWMKQKARKKK